MKGNLPSPTHRQKSFNSNSILVRLSNLHLFLMCYMYLVHIHYTGPPKSSYVLNSELLGFIKIESIISTKFAQTSIGNLPSTKSTTTINLCKDKQTPRQLS